MSFMRGLGSTVSSITSTFHQRVRVGMYVAPHGTLQNFSHTRQNWGYARQFVDRGETDTSGGCITSKKHSNAYLEERWRIDTSKYLNCSMLKVAKQTSAKSVLQECGRMGGTCTRPDAPKAAFAVHTLSLLTNTLYISYFTDKVCNSFHNIQNEQYEIIFFFFVFRLETRCTRKSFSWVTRSSCLFVFRTKCLKNWLRKPL